jgi:hypothetical protein
MVGIDAGDLDCNRGQKVEELGLKTLRTVFHLGQPVLLQNQFDNADMIVKGLAVYEREAKPQKRGPGKDEGEQES